ncbi:MAG: A24 family peptidase [Planctomycetaceae bacterium]|nr:A24 family peptidase [Planctomycetaceae bacterium]
MHIYVILFLIGAFLGYLACEFADRWGCSKRYHSTLPKKIFIVFISGIAAAWLYWWEVQMGMLNPAGLSPARTTNVFSISNFFGFLYFEPFNIFATRYSLHLILFTFLLAATLTDFYEMIIPDSITVVGTVTALCLAVLFSLSALPVTELHWTAHSFDPIVAPYVVTMHAWSPNPANLYGIWSPLLYSPTMFEHAESLEYVAIDLDSANFATKFAFLFLGGGKPLLIASLLWWFWCFAMLDRVWYTKLPFRKANAIFWRYLYRSPRTKYIIAVALLAPIGFAFVLNVPIGDPIASGLALYSALVGMATGMILVWGIRLVARWVLGVEAMGFGDVTLMGMIGAFLGWQAVLLVFFAAPFFGLVYGIVNVALGRGRAVPYGPFLCLATVVVVIAWSPIWSATAEYFAFGIEIIGIALLVLLVLFGGLLHVVHKVMLGWSSS